GTVGTQPPQMCQFLRDVLDRRMIAGEQRFFARNNERAPRIAGLKYFRSQVLDYSLNFMSVGDKRIAGPLAGSRPIEQHATAYQQDYGHGEGHPGYDTEGKAHCRTVRAKLRPLAVL